jgi:porin
MKMDTMKRILCVVVTFLCAANLCHAEDSLEAKLAKLEAASKTRQSTSKSTVKTSSTKVSARDVLSDKVKTLAERLDEIAGRQKGMQEASKGLDARLAELEQRFKTSKVESQSRAQKAHDALYAKLAELDSKVQGLEAKAKSAAAKQSLLSAVEKAQDSPVVPETAPQAAPEQKTEVAQVAEVQVEVEATPTQSIEPVIESVEPRVLSASAVADPVDSDLWSRDTLTNGFGGLADKWADSGVEVGLSWTNVFQANTKGGTSTNQRQGRHTGSYDLEITSDLQKLLGIEGGTLYVHTEGSWSRVDIDETSIGSVFGVNGDGAGRRAMDVTEFWYEHAMLDDTLLFRFGKLDIGGGFECRGCPVSFDGSAYANDETAQFLNNALVNNPTIPMPDVGLGAVLYWNPIEWWYASIGAADAQADGRETGFRTTFTGEDYFFYAVETGVAPVLDNGKGPMPGAYRIGVWNDSQDKERFSDASIERDDVGFYISADQMVYKETEGEEDSQGLGVFTRYGMADKKVNDITDFWSLGLQYQGLFDGRDDDVLGLGYAKGIFSTEAGFADTYESVFDADTYESVFEIYYNAAVAPWLSLSPSVQFVDNPGGDNAVDDAVVVGLRAQGAF